MAERKKQLHAARTGVRIAVVGADSLLGRELRDQLNDWSPSPALELISATVDDAAVLDIEVSEEEPLALVPLNAQSLEGAKVAILAGTPASSRRALKYNPASGPVLIDLTGALEDHPQARLRAPLVQGQAVHAPGIQVVANAASSALAALYITLAEHTIIRRSLAHIFEPASERGKQGLNELQQQTVAVLAFKKLKKEVFDAQLAFNVLARVGEEALESTDSVEARIGRHLASLLAAVPAIPMPSLRLVQAPVFHGFSISVWIEFARDPGTTRLERILGDGGFDIRTDDPPSNAGIAGQSELSVGAIAQDPNQPNAYWMWLVADNVKWTVDNALAVVKEFL